jgi:hypothetical protein
MTRSTPRPARKPKAASAPRPATVFRDFVRQLEKLDAAPRKEGGR